MFCSCCLWLFTPDLRWWSTLMANQLTYLALGDSYTIGQDVTPGASFPYQLQHQLEDDGLSIAEPLIIATTGWTSSELIQAIKEQKELRKFDFVTLLIGVNNQYRGESKTKYQEEFKELLQTALNFAHGLPQKVFVLSIPDWGVTPYGMKSGRDLTVIAAEINEFNRINREEARDVGANYTDITGISRLAPLYPGLVAADGLHPSAEMYHQWVNELAPIVLKRLK